MAGFGRLTWAFTDAFRATGGIRYTWEKKEADGYYLTMNTICPGSFIPPPAGPQFCFGGFGQVNVPAPQITLNQSNTWDKVTWRGALEYDVTSDSLLYASVETGFKSGGFSLSSSYPVYQPETITAYTLGSKNRFFDKRLQLNLEVFDWDYKDQQISHLAYDANGTLVFPTLNVGHSTIRGAEANIQWLATTNTLLGVDAQYLHSRYDDYNYGTPYFGVPPASGCPYTIQPGPPTLAVLNCSGMTPPQSPEWTINLNARQTLHVGSYKLIGTVDAHYQSSTMTGLDFLPVEEQKSYWVTDAFLSWSRLAGTGRSPAMSAICKIRRWLLPPSCNRWPELPCRMRPSGHPARMVRFSACASRVSSGLDGLSARRYAQAAIAQDAAPTMRDPSSTAIPRPRRIPGFNSGCS